MTAISQMLADSEAKCDVTEEFTANVFAFFAQSLVDDLSLGLEDGFENIWLAVLIAVGADR